MSIKELKLENMTDINGGRVAAAFDRKLEQAIADCQDRPGEKRKRTVTVEVNVEPVMDDVFADEVTVTAVIKSKMPASESKPVVCTIRKIGTGVQAVFNDMSEDDTNQKTIDEIE